MISLPYLIAYAAVGHVARHPVGLTGLASTIGTDEQSLLDCLIRHPNAAALLDVGEKRLYIELEPDLPAEPVSLWDWIPAWTIPALNPCEMCGELTRQDVCQDCRDTFNYHF